jgi:hypothetical protein
LPAAPPVRGIRTSGRSSPGYPAIVEQAWRWLAEALADS